MQKILNVYKPKGLTPLQTINLLREKLPEYRTEKIGFAGRLDPLAHGVLLLMVGEETTKAKDTFLNLPKEYEFEAVFGVATDTYDALGLLTNNKIHMPNDDIQKLKNEIENFIKSKLGKNKQIYPPYSSKTVNGKPLYLWAREGKLSEITIPEREIEIYSFHLLSMQNITKEKLQKEIMNQIASVDGDFRQKEIKEKWKKFFYHSQEQEFTTARFCIKCSSGTYVRSLIRELGEKTGTEAISLEILRTKAGPYSLRRTIRLS